MGHIWEGSQVERAGPPATAEPLEADILIAGAGPAGAALALALAGRHRVVMAGRQPAGAWPHGETLPGAARAVLRDLGHLAAFEAEAHLPSLGRISAWGGAEVERTDGFRDPHGAGWRLDRTRFDTGLIDAAIARGCRFEPSGMVENVRRENASWRVRFVGGLEVRCRFVVDATGRRAALARRLGAHQTRLDQLVSVYARLPQDTKSDLDGFSTVLSQPDGWWYRAALPGNECLVAFHTDRDLVGTVRASCHSLTGTPIRQERKAAWTGRLSAFGGPSWAAIGDAACSFDPLSSQGLFNALHGAIQLSRAIDDGFDIRGYATGLETVWARFLQHRSAYYSAEQRWNHAPFWQRRHMPAKHEAT